MEGISEGKIKSGEVKKSGAKVIIPLFPQQTDAQTNALRKISPLIIAEHNVKWCGIFLWPVWVSSPSCAPSQPPAPWGQGQSEKQERPWHFAHCTQQTHCCVISPALITSLQQSSYKKINFIPAWPSTPSKLQAVLQWNCNSTISTSWRTAGCYSMC